MWSALGLQSFSENFPGQWAAHVENAIGGHLPP